VAVIGVLAWLGWRGLRCSGAVIGVGWCGAVVRCSWLRWLAVTVSRCR
jgi:hypothetical protein